MTDRLNAADALYATAAEVDEPPLWQALADALNALSEYGLNPVPDTRVIDTDYVHGSCKRPAGKRLAFRSPDDQGTPPCWVVEDRNDATRGA
ncbi:hypothetical protein [Streptomyces sp. NPDC007063]|uniref:hypothetical protein n=1 Tax=Streptomyces sp. NPDC007063 TaxID=3364772 RepID=UPI0036751B68